MLFVVFAGDDSVGAYLPCQWAGRRSNPRLRFFRPPLDRLSYQPKLGSLLGVARWDADTKKGSMVWRDPRAFLEQCLHEEVVR